jgi:hypothetical protein
MKYYDLFQLGRLIKRLYFEGAGLYFKNRKNSDSSERELADDCEIVNNKAYELSQKLNLNHLEYYWKQIFDMVENNISYDREEFLSKINKIYKLIDISINESLPSEELKFYKLGVFLSESWIYMVASKSLSFDMTDKIKSITIPSDIKLNHKKLNVILDEILESIHNADINLFNKKIDNLIEEIKLIDNNRKSDKTEGGNMEIKISGNGHNIQIGNENKIIIKNAINALKDIIDNSDAPEEDKKEAKNLLKKVLEHPIISAIVGGVISSL